MPQTIKIATDARGITQLTLARPDKRNALSARMIDELTEAAATLGADDATRVVILNAQGQTFCAGGDLRWMQDQMQADRATRFTEARKLAEMLQALNLMPKPLIGAVQGNAFGGGLGIMAVCDMVIAAQEARFGLTETRLGLIPATIGPYVIARMGEARARQVFMSAKIFDANAAQALGLVAQIVPAQALMASALAEAEPYLATVPRAVAAAKALTRRLGPVIDAATIDASITALVDVWEGDEAREGIDAFFAKRPPNWQR